MAPEETKPILRGERVCLRDWSVADTDALTRILTEPEVARWWGSWNSARVRDDLGDGWVIVIEGAVSGWLEFNEETEPNYRHVGLDIALATALHGRAYGPEALRLAVRHFADRGHHRFTIDPAADNERALRAYAKSASSRSACCAPTGAIATESGATTC